MNPSSQHIVRTHFIEPAPLFSFTDLESRRTYAQQIETYIQTLFDDFRPRTEHIAAILLVNIRNLAPNGNLAPIKWGFDNHRTLKGTLNCIDAFTKHYMLLLNPNNSNDSAWAHAVPETLDLRPDHSGDIDDDYLDALTDPDLRDYPEDIDEEDKCRKRDGDVCVVTGKANPKIFWFSPSTLNNTVRNNDMTGNLAGPGGMITGAPFLVIRMPNPFCNKRKLGGSHKAWNMLCVDPALYKPLTSGLCAFKHHEDMPRLKGRFGQTFDMETDWQPLMDELQASQDKSYPPPSSFEKQPITTSGEPLRSGHVTYVTVPEQDVRHLKSAVKVHWACSMFTSLCGASGRPYLLSGKEFGNDVFQWVQDQARQEEE
uniref:HNH nuclease domain-containing protein n=1 Tax=Gibberella zeae TaxID=5518 RepID=A0A4E9EIY9_GIBZA